MNKTLEGMRNMTALFLAFLCVNVWGQPVNDHCINAYEINLGGLAPCPSEEVVSAELFVDNLSATPSDPAIQLANEFGSGTVLDMPLADVWFSFTAVANRISFSIEGDISSPTYVLFQADNCNEKFPVSFSVDAGEFTAAVIPGKRYLIMFAGGSLNDQGAFIFRASTFNDCNTCARRQGSLYASPAPENGTYQAGQEIEFCYTIDSWDPGFGLEFLHALQFEFGEGWDLNNFSYTVPESCTAGNWEWYDSWQSCNTAEGFGPGFAFDAANNTLCPGNNTPFNPGNNFGDGPCGTLDVSALPLAFCFSLKVKDNFSSNVDANLNIDITLLGDGYSGSWMQFNCTDESRTSFLATAVPAGGLLPEIELANAACATSCDGQLNLIGQGNSSWQYALYDEQDNMVYSAPAFTGQQYISDLCPGSYEFEISETNGALSQRVPVSVPEVGMPQVQAGYLPACSEADPFQLVAGLSYPSGNATYNWTGPDNYSASVSSPLADEYGTYTLQVTVDGCLLPEKTIETQPLRDPISCEADATSITFTWEQLPTDTSYEVMVISGQSGSWIAENTYRVEGLVPEESAEIELYAEGEGYCNLSILQASCQALECAPPDVDYEPFVCAGNSLEIQVDNTDLQSINWSPDPSLSCLDCPNPIATPNSTNTYELTTTNTDGCTTTQSLTVEVNSLPSSVLPNEPLAFCPGEPFAFCLPEENEYLWFSPIGFISPGDCLVFPYTNTSITGEYKIRVRMPDGCQFYESLTIYPSCQNGLIENGPGIDFQSEFASGDQSPITVFPNPTRGILNLNFQNDNQKSIILYDLTGSPVKQLQSTDRQLKMDLSILPAGTYLLSVNSANDQWQKRVVLAN